MTPRKIILALCGVHVLFLGFLLFGPPSFLHKKHPPRLVVRTITPQPKRAPPKQTLETSPSKPTPKQQPTVAEKEKVAPAKPIPKPPIAKPSVSKPSAAAKKAPPAPSLPPKKSQPIVSDELTKELEKQIAALDKKQPTAPPSSKKSAAKNPTLHIDGPLEIYEEFEGDYTQNLIYSLQEALHLPEFGEVKIQLTLRQDGSVVKLTVLKTESALNKTYLEAHLPTVRFPPFDRSLAKKEHTFVLTFCNKI